MIYYLLFLLTFLTFSAGRQWPLPYKATQRLPVHSECKSLSKNFCKDGLKYGAFPVWWSDDTLNIYSLSKIQEELKDTAVGRSMTTFTLGLRSKLSGKNYTISWEPLSRLSDTIAPKIFKADRVVWCNQAAVCLRENRDSFKSYHTQAIGNVSGMHMSAFEVWIKQVNNTMPFQQEFLNHNGTQVFLSSFDSTIIFMRSINMLHSIGATFKPLTLHTTIYTVVSEPPVHLGNETVIQTQNSKLWKDIVSFYGDLQATSSGFNREMKKIALWWKMHVDKKFYYYYNSEYWRLHVKSPYLHVTSLDFKLP